MKRNLFLVIGVSLLLTLLAPATFAVETAEPVAPPAPEAAPAAAPESNPLPVAPFQEESRHYVSGCGFGQVEVNCLIDPDPCGRVWKDSECCPAATGGHCEPILIPDSLCYAGVVAVCN